jgi:hypothetical protein
MNRPTLPELAKARAELQRFLATNPDHELAPTLRVMLRATAPFTKEEALPVIVANANEAGGWEPSEYDDQRARDALNSAKPHPWFVITAQRATLQHFFGGAS